MPEPVSSGVQQLGSSPYVVDSLLPSQLDLQAMGTRLDELNMNGDCASPSATLVTSVDSSDGSGSSSTGSDSSGDEDYLMSSGVEHDSSDNEADIDLFAAMPTLTDTDFLSDSDSEEDHCDLDLLLPLK